VIDIVDDANAIDFQANPPCRSYFEGVVLTEVGHHLPGVAGAEITPTGSARPPILAIKIYERYEFGPAMIVPVGSREILRQKPRPHRPREKGIGHTHRVIACVDADIV